MLAKLMEIDNSPADLELTTGDSPSTSAVQPAAGDQPDVIVDQTQISLNEGTGAEENPDETVTSADETESEDLVFSESDLAKLHEMITRQRWVVPVLPDGELPKLLRAAIDLLKRDPATTVCDKFFEETLPICFQKIITDDAVKEWKLEIHKCIFKCCELLLEVAVLIFDRANLAVLDCLAIVLNPKVRFHQYNASRSAESVPPGDIHLEESAVFAKCEQTLPKGWLVDLINIFGRLGGFNKLLIRFESESPLSVTQLGAYVKPFGQCADFLVPRVIQQYFFKIVVRSMAVLQELSDEELKKECSRGDGRENPASLVLKQLRSVIRTCPQSGYAQDLDMLRLKIITRLLQVAPFGGKMNALNELNRILQNAQTYYTSDDTEDYLNSDKLMEWIREGSLFAILLRENLHHVQYVERLEKVFRFVIKENGLTSADLDLLWGAQQGRHEMIVKNIHSLLAKLAWDFNANQLDHLFQCFQASWRDAGRKEKESLLELMRKLAEDDKEGMMASKVLQLLWSLAHDADLETEMVDLALGAHVKILDYSCAADKDAQKQRWMRECIAEMDGDTWVVPAMKQFREICNLYPEAQGNSHLNHQLSSTHIGSHMPYRNDVMRHLQDQFSLVVKVSESLIRYVEQARVVVTQNPNADAFSLCMDGRYNHNVQVKERLSFIKFLLKDGQMWLCEPQAKQLWDCLVAKCVFITDRDLTFKWFAKLMGEVPDLDPEITRSFFEGNILQLDPVHLTENGLKCFENFFKTVNCKLNHLTANPRTGTLQIDSSNLLGDDYLWKIILSANDEVAFLAIEFMKNLYSSPSPQLFFTIGELHSDFTQQCSERLKSCYDTLQCLVDQNNKDSKNQVWQQTSRLGRTLKVLYEYIWAYDTQFDEERRYPPLYRMFWGHDIDFIIRIPGNNRVSEEFVITGHSNQSLLSLRRQILKKILQTTTVSQGSPVAKVELQYNNEPLEPGTDDRKILADFGWRGKVLLTVRATTGGPAGGVSSPDASSSDSSPAETPHTDKPANSRSTTALIDSVVDAEGNLPGVLLAHKHNGFVLFIFKVKDLSSRLDSCMIGDCATAILHQLPASLTMVEKIRNVFLLGGSGPPLASAYTTVPERNFPNEKGDGVGRNRLDPVFFAASPSEVLYCLELTYCLLFPADLDSMYSSEEETLRKSFFLNGGIETFLGMLVRNNFMPTPDVKGRFTALSWVLKILKFGLAVVVVAKNRQNHQDPLKLDHFVKAMLPYDRQLREVAIRTGLQLEAVQLTHITAEEEHAKAVMKLIWAAAANQPLCSFQSFEEIHSQLIQSWQSGTFAGSNLIPDVLTGLDVLILMSVLSPDLVEVLDVDNLWTSLMFDLLFADQEEIRQAAEEHIMLVTTQPSDWNQKARRVSRFLEALLLKLNTMGETRPCSQYFATMAGLLNYCRAYQVPVRNLDSLLEREVSWLKRAKEFTVTHMESYSDESILCGHLQLTKELVAFLSPERKFEFGSKPGGPNLIRDILDDFVLPSSRMYADQRQLSQLPRSQTTDYSAEIYQPKSSARVPRSQTTIIGSGRCVPVCESAVSANAAYELLVALVVESFANLEALVNALIDMFYDEESQAISEWEYIPPVGLRPTNGFVGLKNGGATCYMNSVIQQLFMMCPVREGLLSIDCGPPHSEDDSDQEENVKPILGPFLPVAEDVKPDVSSGKKEYNLNILRNIQLIFGHLSGSQLQFYVPRKFWKLFRFFGGEPINLREQHDAVEFMGCLMDSLDEAAKSLGQTPICQSVFGGVFADQKICRTCPHKYSRKEPFLYLNVDIRNANSLTEALTEYVRGELLEGGDAYMCETCNAKVDAVKRISIEKLPKILAIQLKRFDYDWERDQAVKFNDYFEFPRDLNMEPYTVHGLAKQGEPVVEEDSNETSNQSCLYALSGIVVHSGQANGGHYYSYILHKCADGVKRWYKFDDGEVSEANVDNEDEMRNQCFGGEHTGEVYDPMLKRMSVRRQKRWWNAYILFYERLEQLETDGLTAHFSQMSISLKKTVPSTVEKAVRLRNMRALHHRNQFSPEYFNFIKRLVSANIPAMRDCIAKSSQLSRELETVASFSMKLAEKFLFMTAFHAKKIVRSPCQDWSEVILHLVQNSFTARMFLATQLTVHHRDWFSKYLLECPSAEVRMTFSRILLYLMQYSKRDSLNVVKCVHDVYKVHRNLSSISDCVLFNIHSLLEREVSEFGRHLQHYFNLFYMYATLGYAERSQLINMNTIADFMYCATDEGPGPAIRYQYPEFHKLYATVSLLVRSCELPARIRELDNNNSQTVPVTEINPYALRCDNYPPFVLPPNAAEFLFEKSSYVKKLLEDQTAVVMEENLILLKFCCWENVEFSRMLLAELLSRMSFAYAYELRPIHDVLLMLISMDDSLQSWRIVTALRGITDVGPGEAPIMGLLDNVLRNRSHCQKRAYQIIKRLTVMFSQLPVARHILASNGEFKRKYSTAIRWLIDEYDRGRSYPAGGHYGFSQWSSQPVSNETSTGFFLERTPSVRGTIQNASALMREVCGEEDRVDVDGDEEITSTPPSKGNGHAPLTRTGSGAVLPVYRANLDESLQGIPEDPKTSPLVKLATTPVDSANSTQSDESPTEVKSPMSAELGSAIRLSKSADSGLATTSDISQTSMRPIGSVSFTSRLSESDGTLGGTPALYSTVENLADISREKEKADELVKENANKD